MKKRFVKCVVVILGVLLCGLLCAKAKSLFREEGKLLEILEINQDDIEHIVIAHYNSLRVVEDSNQKSKLTNMLNQNVVFNMKYNAENEGESDWRIYLLLHTGEYLKLGVYDNGITFENKNKEYYYQGDFDLTVLEDVPKAENPTKLRNEMKNYTKWKK